MFIIDSRNNMTLIQGDSALFTFKLENYILMDGNASVIFTVAKDVGFPPVIQQIITSFSDGEANFELTPEQTNIEVGDYKYDIQVNLASGIIDTVIPPSNFSVLGGITDVI